MWCELISDFSRLEELSSAWRRWVSDNERASIFQHWEWARACWKAYGNSASLCALVVRDEERPVGLLPLVRRGGRLEFLGSLESDYNDLICERRSAAQVLETALEFLLQSRLEWTSGVLDHIPAHSEIVRNVPLLPSDIRRHLQLVFCCFSPTIVVGQNGPVVLENIMNKGQLKRYYKKLHKLGPLVFRHFQTREEAREHLGRFFHQHITRCAVRGVRSQFVNPERRAFYAALIEEFDPDRELRFGALELNSRPIAYHFGFQVNKALTWYKPAFDVNYWEYCPGDVLLHELLRYVREHELDELDFTIGDEPFKRRLANQIRHNYILYLERRPWRITSRARAVVRTTQHFIRQKPEWKAAIQNKARLLNTFISRVRNVTGRELLFKTCRNLLRGVNRSIWSRDEVLFHTGPGKDGVGASAVAIAPGTLDDIAFLSVEFGDVLSPAKLQEYRRRLINGDLLVIARSAAGEAFVLWLSMRSEIEVPEVGSRLVLATPALVVDECWTAPHTTVREVPAAVLRSLSDYLGKRPFWVYHVRGQGTFGRAIEEAELVFRHCLRCHSLLGCCRCTWIPSPAERTGQAANQPAEERL